MIDVSRLRFLVVEDDGFQRWAIERTLRELGAGEVHGAEDGRSALELMDRMPEKVDIVVSDLDMPSMDGLEFIRRLGEKTHAVSLIVSSAQQRVLLDTVESMARAYGVRFLASIEKPATPGKLRAAIALYESLPGDALADSAARGHSQLELSDALRIGDILAWFQPKVDMGTGHIVGAEALARWTRDADLVLLPRHFLDDLERHQMMPALTESVMAHAVAACAGWHALGVTASVSVNIPQAALADLTFAERVWRVVDEAGLHPHDVIFEITESAAVSDLGRALENLTRLRMRGFGLAIDDYGTGYSTMQQLTRIPFTELKIDQSFVRSATHHAPSRAVVESSLEIAGKLGLVAVAEGVETQSQWNLLKSLGCQTAQGWLVGRPMRQAQFVETALAGLARAE